MTLVLFVFVFSVLILLTSLLVSCKLRYVDWDLFTKLSAAMLLSFVISACILTWYNPYHTSPHLLISLHGGSPMWGENVNFEPAMLSKPADFTILKQVVQHADKVRVVGSGHSFSPLIVTNDTLVDISELSGIVSFEGDVVTALAGTTVEDVQIYLTQRNRTLHGFGSIHSQTLAGAFSTSLVGTQPTSFASHAVKAWTIDASGVEHQWEGDDLYYLRNSMGLMGVITSLSFETFPNFHTVHETKDLKLDELIELYKNTAAAAFDAATSINKIKDKRPIRTLVNKATDEIKPTSYPRIYQINDFILYDAVAMPIWTFFRPMFHFLFDSAINARDVETALLGRDMKQFGMTYTDYVIPIDNCVEAIEQMAIVDVDGDPLVRIKYLSDADTGCFDVTQVPSCRVEVYASQNTPGIYSYVAALQKIATDHGGFVHWGKLYIGNITEQMKRFSCYSEFEERRQMMDPTDKFINSYLRGEAPVYTDYQGRTWLFHGQLWLTLIIILVVLCTHEPNNMRRL